MILKNLSIENFMGIDGKIQLNNFSKGLNIIYGPNGEGKSTILKAITQSLLANHKSKALTALSPWGRPIGPQITLEFEKVNKKYKLTKKFINSPNAQLYVYHDDSWKLIAESNEAEAQLRKLWEHSPNDKPRGTAEINDWGRGRLLWAPQGNLNLEGLPEDSLNLLGQILGAQSKSKKEILFEKKLNDRYREFFTESGKSKKKDGKSYLEHFKEQLNLAQLELQNAEQVYEKVIEERNNAKIIEQKIFALENNKVTLDEELKKYQLQQEANQKLEKDILNIQLEISKIENELKNSKTLIDDLRYKKIEHKNLLTKKDELQLALQENIETLDSLKKEHEENYKIYNLYAHKILINRENEIIKKLAEIKQLKNEQEELIKKDELTKAPTKEDLKNIEKAQLNYNKAKDLLEASELVLTIENKDINVEILQGRSTFNAQGDKEIRALGEILINLAGVGIIKVKAKNNEAITLEKNLESAQKELNDLMRNWQNQDIETLTKNTIKVDEMRQEYKDIEAKIKILLANQSEEDFQTKLNSIKEQKEKLPPYENLTLIEETIVSELEFENIKQKQKNFTIEMQKLEHNNQLLEKDLDLILKQLINTKKEIDSIESKMSPIKEFTNNHDTNLLALESKKNTEKKWRSQLYDLKKFDTQKQIELKNLDGELKNLNNELNALLTRLEVAGEKGCFNKLQEAQSKLSEITQTYEYSVQQQKAVELLYNLYQEKKLQNLKGAADYLSPLAENIYSRMSRKKFSDFSIKNNIDGITIKPDDIIGNLDEDIKILPNEMSAGERDMLFLSVRLAVAESFSQKEPEMILLDDVISNLDQKHLENLLLELARLSEKMQIILFTCHIERLNNFKSATFFDLRNIKSF